MRAATATKPKKIDAFRKEPSVNKKYLPYSYHLNDYVVSMENGDLMAFFKLDGRTHDCASDRELVTWHKDLNTLVKSFGTDQIELWTHEYHHEAKEYPDGEYDQFFPAYVDKYNRKLHGDSKQLINDLYLTVIYKQVGDKTQKFLSKFEKPTREQIQQMQNEALEGLEDVSEQILEAMKPYGIQQLGIYYRDKRGNEIPAPDKKEREELAEVDETDVFDEAVVIERNEPEPSQAHAYSKALEFLYFLANMEWAIVPVCRERIRDYIMDNRPVSSLWGDVIQIRTVDHNFYTTGIEFRDYEEETEPGQLNMLKEADFEYLLTQSFSCLSESSAKTFLTHQEKSLQETRDRAQSQLAQLGTALDMLTSREFVMGYHHGTVHVWDKDQNAVQRKARRVKVMLTGCGVVGGTISLASEAAYFAKLPGNQKWAPRPVPVNSWNFLHFSSFHNFMRGKPDNNPWGPALTMFRTISGTPLYFNFHVTPLEELSYGKRPLGHALITGMSGEGKTTLLNFLLAQSMKYSPRLFVYDRDRGMEPFIRSVGGYYKVLQQGMPSGFAPLQIEPTKRNIALIKNLFRICVETTNNGPISATMATELAEGVDAVMGEGSLIPREARTVTILDGYVNEVVENGVSLKGLLREWTRKGQYGWLFDNDKDSLDLSTNDIFGFDLSEFIAAKEEVSSPARTPLMMYLLYRVRDSIDGKRRVIQCFDEFHAYLDDPVIEREVKRGIKTDRKKDAIYVFATQEPNDALSSRIGRTIMSQTVTKICLRDPEAIRTDYAFLTDAEYDALMSITEHSRQFLVKQGQQSAIASFNLYPRNSDDIDADIKTMDNILSVLSGEPQNAEIAHELVERLGNEPEVWLKEYWRLTA
ncbi:TPA: VirB4 family type IV secretion/conjugal transfer ATPase [Klebsiella pneumoniae]|nr:VirB4 family type IV secretion/conjugal transfer ATPase [Klebsiella pneumoniae]HBR3823828.1 VirB4 family type IV secretion/conjugal transfer ATPase [Klebsiella pneumoniae]